MNIRKLNFITNNIDTSIKKKSLLSQERKAIKQKGQGPWMVLIDEQHRWEHSESRSWFTRDRVKLSETWSLWITGAVSGDICASTLYYQNYMCPTCKSPVRCYLHKSRGKYAYNHKTRPDFYRNYEEYMPNEKWPPHH